MLRYFKSKEFWLTLLGLTLLGVLAYVLLFFVFLPSYTNHGESVLVPEVTEGDLEEAIIKLDGMGLRFEVADSLYISSLPPQTVISQDPSGMSKVKPGRRIYLTVNKTIPPMVRIPQIYNVSTYQAKLLLEGVGLEIQRIEYIPDEFKNLVRYAEFRGKRVKEGDTLPKFSELLLFVGKGLGRERIAVPELVGLKYQEAISILHKDGLNIGAVRFDPKAPEERGTVIQQYPRYPSFDSLKLGADMTLIISGPEPEESIEDMFFGESESDSTVQDSASE